jgi:hypothetical protein
MLIMDLGFNVKGLLLPESSNAWSWGMKGCPELWGAPQQAPE